MNILVYGDSMSWGIIPESRQRQPFAKRWTGVLQQALGNSYRVIEECLNGRTTQFDDPSRLARNGLSTINMILETHAPIDFVIVMLGINDFQDVIGATARDSAKGLRKLVAQIQSFKPESMQVPAAVMVIIPPEIQKPRSTMSAKFSGYARAEHSEKEYIAALADLSVSTVLSSAVIGLSKVDGIHLDEADHLTLGRHIALQLSKQQR